MTEIITNGFYDTFINLCGSSNKSIKLCAPYVKKEIIEDVIVRKRDEVKLNLITKVNLRNFHGHSSDVEAMSKTLLSRGNVYNCSNLHAKIYVFDDRYCAVTSANLTISGLKRNIECGVFTDDAILVSEAVKYYKSIQSNPDVSRITMTKVNEISDLLSKIPSIPQVRYPSLDLTDSGDENLFAIADNLTGWKKNVFLALGHFGETITSADVASIAEHLGSKYPNNNNRTAAEHILSDVPKSYSRFFPSSEIGEKVLEFVSDVICAHRYQNITLGAEKGAKWV